MGKAFAKIHFNFRKNMLTTNANVKTYLGIVGSNEEDLITLLVKLATGAIQTFVGWEIEKTTHTEERIDGDGSAVIRVKGFPISSEAGKFKYEYNNGTFETPVWVSMATNNYYVDYAKGVIQTIVPYTGFKNLRLTYDVGYSTIPADIEEVAIKVAARMYNRRQSEGLASESLENASVNYSDVLSEDEKTILQKYRLPIFVI